VFQSGWILAAGSRYVPQNLMRRQSLETLHLQNQETKSFDLVTNFENGIRSAVGNCVISEALAHNMTSSDSEDGFRKGCRDTSLYMNDIRSEISHFSIYESQARTGLELMMLFAIALHTSVPS